jgi:hypothetical protein
LPETNGITGKKAKKNLGGRKNGNKKAQQFEKSGQAFLYCMCRNVMVQKPQILLLNISEFSRRVLEIN